MKSKKFWCVEGEVANIHQEYVIAANKKSAIKKAYDQMGEYFTDDPAASEVSKIEYEENTEI